MVLGAFLLLFLGFFGQVSASSGQVLGVHILHPAELDNAQKLITDEEDSDWHYLTIPLSLNDLEKKDEWQTFFQRTKEKKLIPIVRLTSRFEDESWQVPNRKEIVDLVNFLDTLTWPTDERFIVVFNEPNHAKEWGGQVDPESYVNVLRFTSSWAHAVNSDFRVLPAGLDLAAAQGGQTVEAFWYLNKMYEIDADIFSYVDYWNSHSYPNPGFSASPQLTTKNSLRGFQYELDYLKEKTGKDFRVFITETGWVANNLTSRWLSSYYQYAIQHVWSDPRVVAVTPFLLQGDPGPFQGFSFIDRNGNPTIQYAAFKDAVKIAKGE